MIPEDVVNIKQQEDIYKEYIDNHRQNVQKAWTIMKSNSECMIHISKYLNTSIEAAIDLIDNLIINHDMSKYDEFEFNAYRKEFYPVSEDEKEENKPMFDAAWKHHYYNNLHHWNWWYETGNMDNMKLPYVVEMICDWEAMGYKFGNTSRQWYDENRDKIKLGELQRKFAETLMNIMHK